MSDSPVHLSFSIGPVQSFVAQARRTRDLWAGSWLLSHLAETALVATEKLGGQSLIPHRHQPCEVTSKQSAIGGIPNRFELMFSGDNAIATATSAAKAAEDAFRQAWQQIADAVFNEFVDQNTSAGNDTKAIWTRQIHNFWELPWVVGTPDADRGRISHLAAMRKNLRNVTARDEPGTKCSLMPTLQEISGHFGPGQWGHQKSFWQKLRKSTRPLDLKDSEQLCAIALIKRLFPHVITAAIGSDISSDLTQVAWPSTAFVSALPWLKHVNEDKTARTLAESYSTQAISTLGYQNSESSAAQTSAVSWAAVDGPVWFANAIRQDEPGQSALGPKPSAESTAQRKSQIRNLLKQLKEVHEKAQQKPVPFYALLIMDGDSMGSLLQQLRSPQKISACLGAFADNVDNVVKKHDGRTIYAGGDDVLALLPAGNAMDAASTLCDSYRTAFQQTQPGADATISAAVVFAHWRYPLRQVLQTAHYLLDDIAKERTGRDSIATGIVLGSGLSAVWSVPWSVHRGHATTSHNDPCVAMDSILDKFVSDANDHEKANFNASYLYLLRERFGRLFDESLDKPGEFGRMLTDAELLRDLAHAEYRRRMSKADLAKRPCEITEPEIDKLMSLTHRWSRTKVNGLAETHHVVCDPATFTFDGWRIARFLKQVHDGKVDDHD